MKNNKIFTLSLTLALLASCNHSNTYYSNIESVQTNNSSLSEEIEESSSSISSIISSESTTSISKEYFSSSEEDKETPWEEGRILLDCGYYTMDLPKNYQNPFELKTTLSADTSSWSNNDMKEYLPTSFRYIYKNAYDDGPTYHKASPSFYSSNQDKPGGLKIANVGVGFQTSMFYHTGEKLEIRIGISQVNNASGSPEKGKDPFHIYFYNNKGNYIDKYIIEEGSITTNTTEIKFYYTNKASDVAYFELRCNASPYKGSQCYNIGINYCNFKSWERI